jgi:hypothetical protein
MSSINDSVEVKGTPDNTPTKKVTEEVTENAAADLSESEFSRASVEALGNRVRLVDNDEGSGLDLFCYVRCGPTDTGLIRQCRGVVFHKKDVVMKAFPYTIEYNEKETKEIEENIQPYFPNCSFYDAHEGALIRMFYFDGKWYTSTHRKLNAFRSKWASRESFGTSFKRALEVEVANNKELREGIPIGEENLLERFQSTLDTDKQYMFLIRNTIDNRIVCQPPSEPTVYHVGTFVEGDLVMTENVNVPYPTKHSFLNMDELCTHVQKIDPSKLQGVIVFAPENKQYKILNQEYQELFRARGNEPSIKYRYLQVRMVRKQVNMLYYLYPEMADTMDDYENTLYDIARGIYLAYVQRFIKKRFVTVPKEEYSVVRECHTWHSEDRANNRMSVEKVIDVLNQQPATYLNHMIRRFKTEQEKRQETQTVTQERVRSNTVTSATNSPAALENNSPKPQSPLLLTKNRHRNPAIPPPPDLGQAAVTKSDEETRVLSDFQKN